MRIGITVGLGSRSESTVDGVVRRVKELEARGFASVWMTNAFAFDAMTALTAAGRETQHIELGTAVVPTFPRHPVVMAQQARTVQDAVGGRFTLGIGLSHESMMTGALGLSFERPARHMREYLSILAPLLEGRPASFAGNVYHTEASLAIGSVRVHLLVAAMGPVMLRLAGTLADGTILSWVGPRTIEAHIAPTIRKAAAGRPAPRIVAGLPIAVTDDPSGARERFAPQVASYGRLPSYRAMFDREGVQNPADVAVFGDERAVEGSLRALRDAGTTDFAAQVVSVAPGSAARTLDLLAGLAL